MKILYIELNGYKRFLLNQIDHFSMHLPNLVQLVIGTNGSGKAQPLDASIRVPSGWANMGSMKVGTDVIAKDGTTTKVTGVFPKGQKEIFKVTFSDGRSTECCAEHLWKIYVGGKKYPIQPTVVNTLEVIRLLQSKSYNNLVWIDLIDSELNEAVDLPLDPYVLGVFLGDGSSRTKTFSICTPDDFIVNEVNKLLPEGTILNKGNSAERSAPTYRIIKSETNKTGINLFTKHIGRLGLINKLSFEKFIPEIYSKGSTKQRLALVQGLLDTDGTIDKQGTISFSSTSESLARGIQYLIRSLGGIASISLKYPYYTSHGVKIPGRLAYQVNIRYKKQSELFRLPKKKERTNDNNQYAATLKLRIKSIEPIGFKETQCISVEHPDHLYVTDDFIVTHNSSLLWELSPLPANPKHFSKTGSKLVKIENNNSQYVLQSNFTLKQAHSFVCDDSELNPGGTISIQKELVFTHFGLTNDIHEVLTERETFTTMSYARRKELFLQLCDTNYDYAIGVYNKLRERHRDVTGALKLTKKTLVLESEKLLQEAELTALQAEALALHECLSHLLEYRKPVEHDLDLLSFEQQKMDEQLMVFSKTIIALNAQMTLPFKTVEHYVEANNNAKDQQTQAQALLVKLTKDHTKNSDKIAILEKAKGETLEQFNDELSVLNTKVAAIKESLLLKTAIPGASIALYNQFESIRGVLQDIFVAMPSNENLKYAQSPRSAAKEKLVETTTKKKNLINELAKYQASLKHMEEHKDKPDVACPNCKHSFSLNYNEQRYQALEAKSLRAAAFLEDTINTTIVSLELYLEECAAYSRYYNQYIQMTSNSPQLALYWDYIADLEILIKSPERGIYALNQIEADLRKQIDLAAKVTRMDEVKAMRRSLNEVGDVNSITLYKANQEIEQEINHYTSLIQKQQAIAKHAQSECARLIERITLKTNIQNVIKQKKAIYKDEVETTRRQIFNQLIKDLQSALASREHTLGAAANQKKIVDALSNQITIYTEQELALSVLVKELSPTEGLIAEGLLGFIKNFVDQMNVLINTVWSYKLEIKSCDVLEGDSIDLDYKFPMVVLDDDNVVADVNEGSTGMQAIVNLAYRLITMQYRNLKDYPLHLDELGASFDKEHRTELTILIKSLIEQQSFSQLFIISHYLEQYGGMSNADICVLNSNNITLPERYNQHVVLR